jgi:hypothetical protein
VDAVDNLLSTICEMHQREVRHLCATRLICTAGAVVHKARLGKALGMVKHDRRHVCG